MVFLLFPLLTEKLGAVYYPDNLKLFFVNNRFDPLMHLDPIKGELTIAQIASKYTVYATQINKWKKAALAQLPEAFSGKQKQAEKDHTTELSELYEQIGRLKVENEFLKKKCDLFTD